MPDMYEEHGKRKIKRKHILYRNESHILDQILFLNYLGNLFKVKRDVVVDVVEECGFPTAGVVKTHIYIQCDCKINQRC